MAYATRTDLEARFGENNIRQWADLDSAGAEVDITARIATALAHAEAVASDYLRAACYQLPIASTGGVVPAVVVDVVCKLAAVWLYELRGVQDFNPDTGQAYHRLAYQRDTANKMLFAIRSGQVQLDAVKVDDTTAPEVLEETE